MNLCFLLVIAAQFCTSTQPSANSSPNEDKNEPKIVCYYDLHVSYNPDVRDYSDDVIDVNRCTHIVYIDTLSFYENLPSSFHDGKKKFYGRISNFRQKGVHVSISSFDLNLYEKAAQFEDAVERANFVTLLVEFMEQWNFDGFEAMWGCKSCVHSDKTTNELMRQLLEALKPRGWLLSVNIHANKTAIEAADFDIQKLSEYVDWMSLWTFHTDKKNTALNAPLYFHRGDISAEFNANYSINYLIESGVPSHNLVLAIMSGGFLFRLISATVNGLYAPANNAMDFHRFYDICFNIKTENWTVVHDTSRVGTFAYRDDQWTSYDDVEDVYRKAEYIRTMNLGGGAILDLGGDDFENKCGCGKNPLLTAMNQVLRNVDNTKKNNCT